MEFPILDDGKDDDGHKQTQEELRREVEYLSGLSDRLPVITDDGPTAA